MGHSIFSEDGKERDSSLEAAGIDPRTGERIYVTWGEIGQRVGKYPSVSHMKHLWPSVEFKLKYRLNENGPMVMSEGEVQRFLRALQNRVNKKHSAAPHNT